MLRMTVSYEHSWMTNTAKGRFDDILRLSPGPDDDTDILGERATGRYRSKSVH
jgi:hypothetical protein